MRRPPAQRRDAGAIAPVVPVLGFILLLLGGLVIDASRLLNARGRAVAYAEEAARAGASAIEPGQAVLGLDESVVRARVEDYCRAIEVDDEQGGGVTDCAFLPPLRAVSGSDGRLLVVRVAVKLEIPASLLGMVGVQTLKASGEGSARPYEGVDPRDVDSSPPPVDVPVPESPPQAPPGVDVPIVPVPPVLPSPLPSTVPVPSLPPVSPSPTTSPTPSTPPLSPFPIPSTSASAVAPRP